MQGREEVQSNHLSIRFHEILPWFPLHRLGVDVVVKYSAHIRELDILPLGPPILVEGDRVVDTILGTACTSEGPHGTKDEELFHQIAVEHLHFHSFFILYPHIVEVFRDTGDESIQQVAQGGAEVHIGEGNEMLEVFEQAPQHCVHVLFELHEGWVDWKWVLT